MRYFTVSVRVTLCVHRARNTYVRWHGWAWMCRVCVGCRGSINNQKNTERDTFETSQTKIHLRHRVRFASVHRTENIVS